jgi:O-antigen ligase
MTADRVIALLTGISLLSVFLLPSQSGASFSTYLLALMVLVAGTARWREFGRSQVLAGLLIGFLVYFSSSVWWSSESTMRGAFSVYSRCVLILTFIIALSSLLTRIPDFAQWLARGVAIGAGVAAGAALIEFHLHPTWDGRLIGLGQLRNSVIAALSFGAGLLFASSIVIRDSAIWRMIGGLCAVLLALALFQTGSRAGYLGASVGVWTLLVASRRSPPRGWLPWFALPWLGAVLVAGALLAVYPESLAALFPRGDSFRFEIWSAEWQRLLAHPVFGLGILTGDAVNVEGQTFAHPHDLYLASALQGGLVGLLLLLGLLTCAAWRLLRNLHQGVAQLGLALLAAGMSGYLFDGWELIDKVGLSWLLLWMPVAIAASFGATPNEGGTREMVDVNSPGLSSGAAGRRP